MKRQGLNTNEDGYRGGEAIDRVIRAIYCSGVLLTLQDVAARVLGKSLLHIFNIILTKLWQLFFLCRMKKLELLSVIIDITS